MGPSCRRNSLLILLAGVMAAGGCGSAESKPLVFVFQKQKRPDQIEADANRVVTFIATQLDRPVVHQVPLNYAMAVQAMVSKKADVAYLDSLAFLLARRDGQVELLLAEVRQDAAGQSRTDYDSIFVVRADSPITTMADVVDQASELGMVFTSHVSTSGYLMAVRRFVQEGLLEPGQDPAEVFKSVAYAGGYSQTLQQVRDGRGDLCAVSYYTMEGPRADVYLDPSQRQELRILARSPGVPTHVVCVQKGLDAALKHQIKTALLKLSGKHPDWLADVYGAKTLREVDPKAHVAATVEALQYAGVAVDKFVK